MEPNLSPEYNPQPVQQPTKRNVKKVGLYVLIAVLFVALVAVSFLYYQQRENILRFSSENEALKAKDLKTKSQTQTAETTDTGSTTYTAKVGKFTLSLEGTYTIIRELDGVAEGGSATILEVARKSEAGNNVVDSAVYDKLLIHSFPSSSFGSFEEWIKGNHTNRTATKQPPQTFAGVQAAVYDLEGLWYERRVYFQNNDLFYYISYVKDSELSMQTAKDVTNGFKFTD
jgi:hypothetical protein